MRRGNWLPPPAPSKLVQAQSGPAGQSSTALQALLMPAAGANSSFAPGSRYLMVPTSTIPIPNTDLSDPTVQRSRIYLRMRVCPKPSGMSAAVHTVMQGERLDNIAARYFSDPLQFWQICDANAALRPWDLTESPGAQLQIPMPPGVPVMPKSS